MAQSKIVEDSEFHMWRAVFAFSLVDNSLSLEEQELLRAHLKTVPFSPSQLAVLQADFKKPQDVEAMYKKITEPEHRRQFCALARALVWCEGDMDRQEEEILKRVACLKKGDADLGASREHPNLQDFYQHYSRAGMVGLMKSPPGFQMHA